MDRGYDDYKKLIDEHLLDLYLILITRAFLYMKR